MGVYAIILIQSLCERKIAQTGCHLQTDKCREFPTQEANYYVIGRSYAF